MQGHLVPPSSAADLQLSHVQKKDPPTARASRSHAVTAVTEDHALGPSQSPTLQGCPPPTCLSWGNGLF